MFLYGKGTTYFIFNRNETHLWIYGCWSKVFWFPDNIIQKEPQRKRHLVLVVVTSMIKFSEITMYYALLANGYPESFIEK